MITLLTTQGLPINVFSSVGLCGISEKLIGVFFSLFGPLSAWFLKKKMFISVMVKHQHSSNTFLIWFEQVW